MASHPYQTWASRWTPSVRSGRTAAGWTTPAALPQTVRALSSTCTRSRSWGKRLRHTHVKLESHSREYSERYFVPHWLYHVSRFKETHSCRTSADRSVRPSGSLWASLDTRRWWLIWETEEDHTRETDPSPHSVKFHIYISVLFYWHCWYFFCTVCRDFIKYFYFYSRVSICMFYCSL